MLREFEELASAIRAMSDGRRIIYIPNPGNRGDGLIRYGTKMFFEDYGIRHEELTVIGRKGIAQLMPLLVGRRSPLVIYGGGGAWSEAYSGGYQMMKALSHITKHILVLPTTYHFAPAGVRGVLFRRDQAESAKISPTSPFCHDMAFYAAIKRDLLGWSEKRPSRQSGMHFRTDREAQASPESLPGENVDISASGNHLDNIDVLFRGLAESERIITDRLHVCVGSLICKRPVDLFTGNYFKIRAIYESTIGPFFGSEVTLRTDSIPQRATVHQQA
jgi:hypothetical protein